MSAAFWRIKKIDRDASGFVILESTEVGAMVLRARKGPADRVIEAQDTDTVQIVAGKASSTYHGAFEALSYVRTAPLKLAFAVGAGALYSGVDVCTDLVVAFGAGNGRLLSDTPDFTQIKVSGSRTIVGDGLTAHFTGASLPSIGGGTDIVNTSFNLILGTQKLSVAEDGGDITGDDIATTGSDIPGIGSLDHASGAYDFTLAGALGQVAKYTSQLDLAGGVPIGGTKDAVVALDFDTETVRINFGHPGTIDQTAVIAAINAAANGVHVGAVLAYVSDVGLSRFVQVRGLRANPLLGKVVLRVPTDIDNDTEVSALPLIFDATLTAVTDTATGAAATHPTRAVPREGQTLTIGYQYIRDLSAYISHTFYALSPYNDADCDVAVSVERIDTDRFQLSLYQVTGNGANLATRYLYALTEGTVDDSGASLFIDDVFRNNLFLQPRVNPAYTGDPEPDATDVVQLSGGNRGAVPQASDYLAAWGKFQDLENQAADIFMDVYGNSQNTLRDVVENYQPYAFWISTVPRTARSRAEIITFRQDLGIDAMSGALYCNWQKISDTINNSTAWISAVGQIGVCYALMGDVFDGLNPMMVNDGKHGGQLRGPWKCLEMDLSFTAGDDGDLELLDHAQVNPITKHKRFGPMIQGARTLQVKLTDTSYIKDVRMINRVSKAFDDQVLIFELGKQIEPNTFQLIEELGNAVLRPLVANVPQLLNDARTVCSTANNTGSTKAQKKLIVDVITQTTPDAQEIVMRLTRVGQQRTVREFLPVATT